MQIPRKYKSTEIIFFFPLSHLDLQTRPSGGVSPPGYMSLGGCVPIWSLPCRTSEEERKTRGRGDVPWRRLTEGVGEGRPWLMWRQRRPKNISPLPSILANVTCHVGHSTASGVHLPPGGHVCSPAALASTVRSLSERAITISVDGEKKHWFLRCKVIVNGNWIEKDFRKLKK